MTSGCSVGVFTLIANLSSFWSVSGVSSLTNTVLVSLLELAALGSTSGFDTCSSAKSTKIELNEKTLEALHYSTYRYMKFQNTKTLKKKSFAAIGHSGLVYV